MAERLRGPDIHRVGTEGMAHKFTIHPECLKRRFAVCVTKCVEKELLTRESRS